jgi:XTP/dITP diphosphohydrolase
MATGNRHKYGEAKEVLSECGIDLEHMPIERVEIQSDDLSEIAAHSLRQLPDDGRSIMIEDAGLFIDSYGGFPGPYSEYALRKLDLPGILKLMDGLEDREASYRSAVVFKHEGEIHHFHGEVKGRITNEMRGTHGFGYDPIFIPDEGDGRTFGEMTEEEKNAMSHRARAFRNLGRWLTGSP